MGLRSPSSGAGDLACISLDGRPARSLGESPNKTLQASRLRHYC